MVETAGARIPPELHHRHDLRRRLGAGGSGEVWEGTDAGHGRSVAAEAPIHHHLDEIRHTEREARVLASLGSPPILEIQDAGVAPDLGSLSRRDCLTRRATKPGAVALGPLDTMIARTP